MYTHKRGGECERAAITLFCNRQKFRESRGIHSRHLNYLSLLYLLDSMDLVKQNNSIGRKRMIVIYLFILICFYFPCLYVYA